MFWLILCNRSPLLANSITVLSKLIEIPKRFGFLIEEGLFVGDDMRVRDGGKDADLVESVLFLFWWKMKEFDFFEGINLVVLEP